MRLPHLGLSLLLAAGCRGLPTVSGSVEGRQLSSKDAAAEINGDSVIGNTQGPGIFVEIGNFDNICQFIQQSPGVAKASATILLFGVATPNHEVGVGTYSITFPASTGSLTAAAFAEFLAFDGACHNAVSGSLASGGSVTFTTVAASEVDGSFDLRFPAGHLTGSFSVPPCGSVGIEGNLSGCQ